MLDKILKVFLIVLAAYLVFRVARSLYRKWAARNAAPAADGATLPATNGEPDNSPVRSAYDGGPTFGGAPAVGVSGSRYGGYAESGYGLASYVVTSNPHSGGRGSYSADVRQYFLRRV